MTWRRFSDEEDGVTAVVVAVSLVAIFGAAMLSVDAGNLWQSRRNVVTATDATALQEARTAALNGSACQNGNVTQMLSRNGSDITLGSCALTPGSVNGTGYVTVEADKAVDIRFGGVVGIGDTSAYSLSAAQYGYITEVIGLRPMGFCYQNSHMQEWLRLQEWIRTSGASGLSQGAYDLLEDTGPFVPGLVGHPSGEGVNGNGQSYGNGVVHRLYFTKDNPNDCGANAPGNWGWFDYNGGNNSADDRRDWIKEGYPGEVGVHDCDPSDPPGDPCETGPGSSGAANNTELEMLKVSGQPFPIPLFDSVTGSGATAEFGVYGFVGVVLKGYRTTGATASHYFDFEFVNLILEGNCCTATENNFGIKGTKLCAVDHDPQSITTRCFL